LGDGLAGQLVTLRDAATYITKLPKAEQQAEEWQTAIHCLIGAAEGRDFLKACPDWHAAGTEPAPSARTKTI
jgi:hypothetical protein